MAVFRGPFGAVKGPVNHKSLNPVNHRPPGGGRMPAVARPAPPGGARTPARRIVPRRDDSAAPSPPASCSRARGAGGGIGPSRRSMRARNPRHVAIPALAHRSAERAALQVARRPIDARHPGGRSCRRRAPAKPASIPPARSARKRKPKKKPGEPRPLPPPPPPLPGPPQPPAVTPARRRSRRGRPTPKPTSRRTRRCGGRRRRCRMPSSRSACAPAAFC